MATGVQISSHFAFFFATLGLVTVAWILRKRLHSDGILGLLFALHLCFFYGHDPEFIYLMPMFAWFWLRYGGWNKKWLIVGFLFLLLAVPQRVFRSTDLPILMHWRTPILFVLTLWLSVAMWRRSSHDQWKLTSRESSAQ